MKNEMVNEARDEKLEEGLLLLYREAVDRWAMHVWGRGDGV